MHRSAHPEEFCFLDNPLAKPSHLIIGCVKILYRQVCLSSDGFSPTGESRRPNPCTRATRRAPRLRSALSVHTPPGQTWFVARSPHSFVDTFY
eukprot:scaffold17402_cov63-Phaeocystis_antarctica.AAC.2